MSGWKGFQIALCMLTSVFHSNLDGARIFFFSSSCWEDGRCGWISLSKFCSGLKFKRPIFSIDHSVFTKTIKGVISTVQCFDMRIAPEPSFIKKRDNHLYGFGSAFNRQQIQMLENDRRVEEKMLFIMQF